MSDVDLPSPSAWLGLPVADVVQRVLEHLGDRSVAEAPRDWLDALGELLVDATVDEVRNAPPEACRRSAAALARPLAARWGDALEERDPERLGQWSALVKVLGVAASKLDALATERALTRQDGRPRQVLEMLARRGVPVPRKDLLEELDIESSHLSHLLREMEEAALVRRFKEGREVLVAPGVLAQEAADRRDTAWIEVLADELQHRLDGRALSPGQLAQGLSDAGLRRDQATALAACLPSSVESEWDAKLRRLRALPPVADRPLPDTAPQASFASAVT